MQFKVPQFLDIEDKIFGPFTFREFVYLAGGAGMSFAIYKMLGLLFSIVPIIIIAGIALSLTFYRPNNKPLIFMLEAGFKYFTQNKLYIWKKSKPKSKAETKPTGNEEEKIKINSDKLDGSRLRDLAWSLDVLDLSKTRQK